DGSDITYTPVIRWVDLARGYSNTCSNASNSPAQGGNSENLVARPSRPQAAREQRDLPNLAATELRVDGCPALRHSAWRDASAEGDVGRPYTRRAAGKARGDRRGQIRQATPRILDPCHEDTGGSPTTRERIEPSDFDVASSGPGCDTTDNLQHGWDPIVRGRSDEPKREVIVLAPHPPHPLGIPERSDQPREFDAGGLA
ncbi:MAG: hypothetical protein QOE25_841, partial [Actinomycetota bacterium]|nr:hypothetical protein [Actinomycetota bacterium]